ncbi:hypothetical protein BU14_0105s0037 [Porphyra umbilicalis]|uniref:CP-type G domain-containing protein n=1 Tax=Porphyra umbilicalis TaxID=2786 RepID=A0A1X6PCH5_PORUM|nr:hypothetical protein BU14_0105s0037 [Porphyra umbilicalis]|eukprot:OSX78619.1 hypothetical protein BU14_0105s0037 [Porphyra umbilicalis]
MAKSWSKRKTLHHKHKVEKKVREHHRQVRRDSKKNGGSSSGRSRKDPGIPNLFPHKAALMDALNTRREEETAASAAARLERRAANKAAAARAAAHTPTEGLGAGASDGVGGTVPASSSAAGRSGGSGGGLAAAAAAGTETSRRAFMAHFRSVVDAADVLLQVLDARDPLGTRSAEVERAVLGATPPKRLVLILNKVDLVPRAVADTWLRVLRCDYPTVAFRASTQQQRRGLGQSGGDALDAGSAGGALCAGAGALLSLLKTYGRTRGSGKGVASSIAVGVVGYPNVGKSSVVNSLARSRVAAVGATPGVTRNLQEVHLDAHVRLIDCPGIVFAPPPPAGGGGDGDGGDAAADFSASLVLRASVSPQNTPDPEGAVAALLARVGPAPLMAAYTLPAFEDAPTFLALLAKRRGKVTSGGVLDVKAAAVAVLVEWNAGKVPFYTLPPAGSAGAGASPASGAAVVAAWGNDFDVSAVNVMTDGRPDPGGTWPWT